MVMFNSYVKLPEGSWSTANLACFFLCHLTPSYDLIKSSNKSISVSLIFFQQKRVFSPVFSWSKHFSSQIFPLIQPFLGSGNLTHLCTTSTALFCLSQQCGHCEASSQRVFAKRLQWCYWDFTWDAEKVWGTIIPSIDGRVWCLNLSHSIYIYNTQVKR